MRRFVSRPIVLLLLMMLLSAARFAAAAAPAGASPGRPVTGPASHPSQELDPIIPLADFRATPLVKAIDTLRELSKVNIVVRWRRLKDAGVEPESPVDLRVSNLPLQRVLELLGDV